MAAVLRECELACGLIDRVSFTWFGYIRVQRSTHLSSVFRNGALGHVTKSSMWAVWSSALSPASNCAWPRQVLVELAGPAALRSCPSLEALACLVPHFPMLVAAEPHFLQHTS